MTETSDRNELERRLEQARRLAREYDEPLTKGRLARLINEIEDQLRQAEDRLKRGGGRAATDRTAATDPEAQADAAPPPESSSQLEQVEWRPGSGANERTRKTVAIEEYI